MKRPPKITATVEAPVIVVPPKTLPEPPKVGDQNIAPTTTAAEDMITAGQREINRTWENTQMKIALSVIWASLLVSAFLAVAGQKLGTVELQLAAVVFLFGVANLVTGFYFGRTNHARTGGVGGEQSQRDR